MPGYQWDEYSESMPMSTYLLAFAVIDFEFIQENRFTVWSRADTIKSANYALRIGPQVLEFFEEYFGIKYPLPKVDMIALPDFSAGGEIYAQTQIFTNCNR